MSIIVIMLITVGAGCHGYFFPVMPGTDWQIRYVWCIDLVVGGLLCNVQSMANWYNVNTTTQHKKEENRMAEDSNNSQ